MLIRLLHLVLKTVFFMGGVISLGTIIPGISSSVLLMYAGVYSIILDAIGSIQNRYTFATWFGICFLLLLSYPNVLILCSKDTTDGLISWFWVLYSAL